MNCIIVDEDIEAAELLKSHIKQVDFLDLVAVCENGFEALNIIEQNNIDLVFSEIEMASLSGIDLVNSVKKDNVHFVFTSTYTHYAIHAFNLGVLDYLVKPISFHRCFQSSVKFKEQFQLKKEAALVKDSYAKQIEFIFVKSEYENIKVELSSIRYLESLKDYVKIHIGKEKPILTLGSLKKFEEKLNSYNFIRVHKSYIVSVKHIYSVQRNRIVIEDKRIPIGLNYKDNFLKIIES